MSKSSNDSRKALRVGLAVVALAGIGLLTTRCTQEQQNNLSRSIQNWTGTDGVLDVFSEGKVLYRFIKIDKLTTANATSGGSESRAYRFGYGVFDRNLNYIQDADEKKIYFEVSDYSTPYLFYENPNISSAAPQ